MLIQDFLSIENFHFLFDHLQNYAREYKNYNFSLNKENKKIVGKFMEVIYENNFNSMTKQTANTLVLNEIKKIINQKSKKEFLNSEQIDNFSNIQESQLITDLNKPSNLLPTKFNRIFKKQAKGIESDIVVERSFEPQLLYKNVLRNLKFKEHDLTKAPRNENLDLLIPLPDKFKNMFNQPLYIENAIVLIDSRDRNNDLYPNANNYTLKLDQIVRNVISVELLEATIPNSEYLINASNNTIHFQEVSGTTITAEIDFGNYTSETTIASNLQTAMNNFGSSTYTVTFTSLTKRFTIESDRTGGDGIFLLKFKGDDEIFGTTGAIRSKYLSTSIGPILGFSKIDFTDSNSHTSQNNPNLSYDRSIFLNINGNGKNSFDNIESIKKSDFGKFMQLALTSNFGEYTYWNNPRSASRNNANCPENRIDKGADFKIIFNPPITIDKLEIKFKNYNEDLFNFYGLEHSLLFRIEMFNFHYENILLNYQPPQSINSVFGLGELPIIEEGNEEEYSDDDSEYLETEFI